MSNQQELTLHQQEDVILNQIGQSVDRLKILNQNIKIELESQSHLLDETEQEIEHAQGMMQIVDRKIKQQLKKNCKCCSGQTIFLLLLFICLICIIILSI